MPIDFSSARWERVKRNARLWWAGELDRPLIQIAVHGQDRARPAPPLSARGWQRTAAYGPEVAPEEIVDLWDYNLSGLKFTGDSFPVAWPDFGPGVMAAFVGAEVGVAPDTVWFHPRVRREIADLRFVPEPDNYWLQRIKAICRAGVERWNGQVQIGMTDLGGNLDILSTFRPAEELLLDLYDHPEAVKQRTWEAHELWFRYFGEINELLQPVNPGYSAWAGLYSETPHYMLQCDFCYMISPEMFDEFVKPELAAACRRLDNAFYHLDGPGQLPHLDSLLEIEELKGIQWIPGTGNPGMAHWPEVYRKIRAAGKLIQVFMGGDDLDLIDTLADQLGSAKGIVAIGSVGPQDEDRLMRLLDRYGAA